MENTQLIDFEPLLKAGRELGEKSRTVVTVDAPNGQKFALLPGAKKLIALPHLKEVSRNERPEMLKASPVFKDWQSFVAYVTRFKNPNSVVFVEKKTVDSMGNLTGAYRMTAALDFHAAGPDGQSWLDHTATLEFLPCIEWVRWTGIDRKEQAQEDFIEFIEDNLRDIIEPEALTVLDCVQSFEAERIVKIVSKKRLSNGLISMSVSAEANNTTETREAQIPAKLQLSLRPFDGFDPVGVTARLRYSANVTDGLTFTVVLDRLSDVLEPAFVKISDQIKDALNLPLFIGRQ